MASNIVSNMLVQAQKYVRSRLLGVLSLYTRPAKNIHSRLLGVLSLYTRPAKNIHSMMLGVLSLYTWPARNIQSTVLDGQSLDLPFIFDWQRPIIGNFSQIQLTVMPASEALPLRLGASLACKLVSGIFSGRQLYRLCQKDSQRWCKSSAGEITIYSVSCTIFAPSLYIWPVQITQ